MYEKGRRNLKEGYEGVGEREEKCGTRLGQV
jgi:hypothetical protein